METEIFWLRKSTFFLQIPSFHSAAVLHAISPRCTFYCRIQGQEFDFSRNIIAGPRNWPLTAELCASLLRSRLLVSIIATTTIAFPCSMRFRMRWLPLLWNYRLIAFLVHWGSIVNYFFNGSLVCVLWWHVQLPWFHFYIGWRKYKRSVLMNVLFCTHRRNI